jgi:serine/threonine protein phosphatase PrpC
VLVFGSPTNPLQVFKHNYVDQPQLALQEGFKDLDRHWLEMAALNVWDDGSTGVVAMIVNRTLYDANAGDSRAVLCSRQGRAVDMSVDHKPARDDEKERIEKLGGRIIHYGTWRVQGVLAVTRSFGDRKLKQFVSAEPEIKSWPLSDHDEFLILASDGVWDVLSSQAAVDIVRQAMGNSSNGSGNSDGSPTATGGGTPLDVKGAAERLTNAAYSYHSLDNITSMVIDLRHFR